MVSGIFLNQGVLGSQGTTTTIPADGIAAKIPIASTVLGLSTISMSILAAKNTALA